MVQQARQIALSLRSNTTPTAPPMCGGGCVRSLSSDFDLGRQAPRVLTRAPLFSYVLNKTIVGGRKADAQYELFCAKASSSHEFMENKLLAQGLLRRLGLVAAEANIYGAFADGPAGSWPSFDAAQLAASVERAGSRSWVLKGALDMVSSNVLVMTPWRWQCEGWNASRLEAHAARVLRDTGQQGCARVTRRGENVAVIDGMPRGGARRAILVQRAYPWAARGDDAAVDCSAPPPRTNSAFWFELKINVVWGQLGRGLAIVKHMLSFGEHPDAAPLRVGVYFDAAGVLTLVEKTISAPPDILQRVVNVLRRDGPRLQQIARDTSRLFGADYWRLDVFLSESAAMHVNELTYPSSTSDDPRDLSRLVRGYQGGEFERVPAARTLRAISRLLPGQVREEGHSRRSRAPSRSAPRVTT